VHGVDVDVLEARDQGAAVQVDHLGAGVDEFVGLGAPEADDPAVPHGRVRTGEVRVQGADGPVDEDEVGGDGHHAPDVEGIQVRVRTGDQPVWAGAAAGSRPAGVSPMAPRKKAARCRILHDYHHAV
jgi:hypothetical protein